MPPAADDARPDVPAPELPARDATPEHPTTEELEAALDWVRSSPADGGALTLIVARPSVGERELLAVGVLDPGCGLAGDNWATRRSAAAPDELPEPDRQLTIMSHRVASLVARSDERVPLAGDQLFVDLDLSHDNLPAGSLLRIGDALVEISAPPHSGCAKFTARFGSDAMRFVNSSLGRHLRLRGANARVVAGGRIALGDLVRKAGAAE